LKSHIGQSAIVLEYSIHPGSDALVVTISFSETRINHKAPGHSSKRGGESQPRVSIQKIGALTKQCAPARCHGQSTSLGFDIFWDVVGGLAAS
jgi:hypothetical protein